MQCNSKQRIFHKILIDLYFAAVSKVREKCLSAQKGWDISNRRGRGRGGTAGRHQSNTRNKVRRCRLAMEERKHQHHLGAGCRHGNNGSPRPPKNKVTSIDAEIFAHFNVKVTSIRQKKVISTSKEIFLLKGSWKRLEKDEWKSEEGDAGGGSEPSPAGDKGGDRATSCSPPRRVYKKSDWGWLESV